ncbi:MAG: capsid protein [Circoviridae sp.]|uniref:Capsid protein n=1 Tax=Circoviridae sp. TaxID=1954248 RepID=A0A345N1T8_9VIRU|nr:MAG: capsid protein [Circoviridae sp.]AXH77588.1 MAG: capsid protein [Circoviridae sp.]
MVSRFFRKRAVRRTRRRAATRLRRFRRRTYRRRTYRRRRYRKTRYQPKTVNMKYKTVHSIGDFINLPHRLSDPALIYYAYANNSPATELAKAVITKCLNNLYSFVSTDYLSNMDKYTFSTQSTGIRNGAPNKIGFNAWNPYLDSSLLGSNYNVYATMYNYFKYRGIKVKWIPNVKTSSLVQPKMTSLIPETENLLYSFREDFPVTLTTTEGNTVTEYREGQQYAAYSNSGTEGGGIGYSSRHLAHKTTGEVALPTYKKYKPEYTSYSYAPALKMHVLFAKDDYDSTPLVASPLDSPDMINDTVYKSKPYVQNMKTQNYKIYDMSKPFKFYCRPYCASKADEITGYDTTPKDDLDTNTKVYSGNVILKKKTRLPKQVVNYDSMVNLVDPSNTEIINKWQARISDKNFLNPVLFGYFFTCDGIEVDSWFGSITGLAGIPEFDKCVPKYDKLLSSYGHFEITVYATFSELNNIKNN